MESKKVSPRLTLQQLEYFLSSVRTGSLSAAAEEHFIAQPSLSEQIRRLERQLDVSLFVRTNRKLILTDAGKALVPHAERTLEAAQACVDAVAPVRDLTGGTVAFGTFSIGKYLFQADLVEAFQRRHPDVSVRLVASNSVQIADEVREGRLECAVVALPINDRGLEVEPLKWSPETVYLSAFPERTQQPMTMERLTEARLVIPEILWGDADPTRLRLLLNAQRSGHSVNIHLEVESPASALELAARGIADTVLTYTLAHELGTLDSLSYCSLQPAMRENFGIIRRKGADISPAASVLIDLTKQLLNDLPETGS